MALSWALEVGEPSRFSSVGKAVSYCGLCSAQRESANKQQRGPLSKQRNKYLQSMLVEAAKLAPRYNEELRQVRERELERGSRNRATLAVARKLAAYLLAVDRRQEGFELRQGAAWCGGFSFGVDKGNCQNDYRGKGMFTLHRAWWQHENVTMLEVCRHKPAASGCIL